MFNFGDLFVENKLNQLSKLGDSLEKLTKFIDFELFRPALTEFFTKENKGVVGRPPYDYVLMFKIIILQRIYNISDDAMEYQINDRLSFMRFLNLGISDKVPDSKTIWHYKNELAKENMGDILFDKFNEMLVENNIITNEGSIIDASFVECPRQRNTKEENEFIKEKQDYPEDWSENKKNRKDVDAQWTKKGNQRYFGYKNHVKADEKTKLIKKYDTTPANVHDSQICEALLDATDNVLYADSAYTGKDLPDNIDNQIHERAFRNKPLTEEQIKSNSRKSKKRCRIEHIFGFIENSMNGSTFKGTGLTRAKFNVAITNLTYNLFRYTQLKAINGS